MQCGMLAEQLEKLQRGTLTETLGFITRSPWKHMRLAVAWQEPQAKTRDLRGMGSEPNGVQ